MRRFLASLLTLAVASVSQADETVRVERGPLLRTFERPVLVTGGVSATAQVSWPTLSLLVTGYDTCRTELVEEYAEEHIEERSSRAGGAAISAGVFFAALGVGLLAAQGLMSNVPDTSVIDGAGRYGPSQRTVGRGFAIGFFIAAVPTFAVGLWSLLRSGTQTQSVKVEQVASQKDVPCRERPLEGPVVLVLDDSTRLQGLAREGLVSFDASQLGGKDIGAVTFFERQVVLDDEAQATVDAFGSCAALEQPAPSATAQLPNGVLIDRLEHARSCRALRPAQMAPLLQELSAELDRRPGLQAPPEP